MIKLKSATNSSRELQRLRNWIIKLNNWNVGVTYSLIVDHLEIGTLVNRATLNVRALQLKSIGPFGTIISDTTRKISYQLEIKSVSHYNATVYNYQISHWIKIQNIITNY